MSGDTQIRSGCLHVRLVTHYSLHTLALDCPSHVAHGVPTGDLNAGTRQIWKDLSPCSPRGLHAVQQVPCKGLLVAVPMYVGLIQLENLDVLDSSSTCSLHTFV